MPAAPLSVDGKQATSDHSEPSASRPSAWKPRVWVWPNGRALGLLAILIAMCYAGASQNNGAAYLLCFLLTSLALVSMVHAWVNLQELTISLESIPPVFAGDEVAVPVVISGQTKRPHFDLWISVNSGDPFAGDTVTAEAPCHVEVRFPSERRGLYRKLSAQVTSDYPLGFFTGQIRVEAIRDYYVYPAPHGSLPFPIAIAPTRQNRDGLRHEGDDFGGTRLWQQGESQRHIDWKAAARNPQLLTKQWSGDADEVLQLAWESLPNLATEARLSQLAQWVITAERAFQTYELRLPSRTIRAGRGDQHLHECLRALAAFDIPPQT